MALKEFKIIKTDDPTITKIQQNIANSFQAVVQNPALDSQLLTNVSLKFGIVNQIPHGLSRNLTGYRVIPHGQTRWWDTQVDNPSPNLFLFLNVATTCTADIEVW